MSFLEWIQGPDDITKDYMCSGQNRLQALAIGIPAAVVLALAVTKCTESHSEAYRLPKQSFPEQVIPKDSSAQ